MTPHRDTKTFNPFPGLRPFTPEESDLFFGREGESDEVLSKLLKNRFVTVMGASGTGKSSLIYCGVLPGIKKLKENSKGWRIVSFRPGSDPFGNLTEALGESFSIPDSKKIGAISSDITGMISSIMTDSDERLLLVIDQFEELFRYGTINEKDNSGTARFIDSLVAAVTQSAVNIFTIITMRSDFIGECAVYQGLTRLINNSNYLVPHMGPENYRKAIEGPVKYAGAKIDPDLVDNLLSDIGERNDQLPVLQHAMMRTWTYWLEMDEPERPISKSDYVAVGTMSDAMSMHANEAFEELSPRGREICERMFKTITEKGSDNKGIRHPSSIKTIRTIAGCTAEELFVVVEKFRVPSRSFITPRYNVPLSDESIIDVSHESLMRLWGRLREWVDDEASSVQMYLRLSEASALYQKGKTSLWRPPDLQIAINWRDQHKPTLAWAERYDPAFERAMVYLRTSEKEFLDEEQNKIRLQKRQLKRTRIVAGILLGASIISLGFMLFAFIQQIAAERQRVLAEQRKTEAEQQRLKADSTAVVATQQRSLAIQNASLAEQRAEEARIEKENAERQRKIADLNANLAHENETLANIQKDSATRAKERALTNEKIAKLEREKALQLRMLSIGKAMSIKSLQAQSEKDLQALLAYQAYIFNNKYNGIKNDADIYAGLYNVSRQTGSGGYVSYKGHNGEIRSIAYVPGKNEFFTSGSDGRIIKWSMNGKEQTLQVIYSGKNEKTGAIEITDVIAVSPDASWLACGTSNTTIRMIPLKPDATEYVLTGHKGRIKSLIYSYDGKYLYSAALDGKVLKWDLAARTSTNVSDGSMKITSIDISSKDNMIAGITSDGKVVVWDPERMQDNFRLETTEKNIKVVRFSPGNNLLAIGDINGNVEIWDVILRKKISEIKAHDAQVNDIRFNSLYNQLATAGNDKKLKLFNLANLTEPPITFADNEGFVLVMQFSPDGQLIVSGAYEGNDNLISRPSYVDYFIDGISDILTRNMTQEEWNTYVARDIPYEQTYTRKNYIKVSAIK
jgi:WD40 repeat protein